MLEGSFWRTALGNAQALSKVQDEGVILNMLQGAKDHDSEVYIWRFLGGNKHVATVKIESLRKQRGDFCIVPYDGQDRIVQELMGSLNYIDLYIPSYALLLRCTVKQTDAPFRYYLQIPLFVAQIERRQSLRLNVQDKTDIKLNFSKSSKAPKPITQHFLKSCYDISSGGVSFFVSKLEAKLFQSGDVIPQVEIKAGNWSGKVRAEILTVSEIEPNEYNGLTYKAWRITCRFTEIDQISKKYLEKFIFERIKDELHVINS